MPTVKINPKDDECCPEINQYKNYPYGTSLDFEDTLAEQLGVDTMAAGNIVEIRATAFVKSKSEHTEGEGEIEKRLCLQLTEVSLMKTSTDRVKTLYGDDHGE